MEKPLRRGEMAKSKKKRGYPIIKQRTTTSPISITNRLGDTDIVLEIKATKENWNKLVDFSESWLHEEVTNVLTDPECSFDLNSLPETESIKKTRQQLGEWIARSFIPGASKRLSCEFPEMKFIVDMMKVEAVLLYKFMKFCLKEKTNYYPFVFYIIKHEYVEAKDYLFCSAFLSQVVLEFFDCYNMANIKPFVPYDQDEGVFLHENFYVTYVNAGQQLLKKDYNNVFQRLLWLTMALLKGIPKVSIRITEDYEKGLFLWLTIFHCAFFYSPASDHDPIDKEIVQIRNVLHKIFPQFFYEEDGKIFPKAIEDTAVYGLENLEPLFKKVVSMLF
jgi:hypothetical protein